MGIRVLIKRSILIIGIFVMGGIFIIDSLFVDKRVATNNIKEQTDYKNYNLPRNNYDWNYLMDVSGKKEYRDKNGVSALKGIDVSSHQEEINWTEVKKDDVQFAMIRAGYRGYREGNIVKDTRFDYNIKNAINSGINVGVYFFSQAITKEEATEEADFVLNNINGYKLDFPVVFDLEEVNDDNVRTSKLSRRERTDIALAFCNRIEESGQKAMIYGTGSWLINKFYLDEISTYDIWIAHYNDKPSFVYKFNMWQYTEKGRVKGISEPVDLNLCFTNS